MYSPMCVCVCVCVCLSVCLSVCAHTGEQAMIHHRSCSLRKRRLVKAAMHHGDSRASTDQRSVTTVYTRTKILKSQYPNMFSISNHCLEDFFCLRRDAYRRQRRSYQWSEKLQSA